MIVVSDTTAITTLLKAGEERLLREMFGTVTVPSAVWDELSAFHSALPDFILLRTIRQGQKRLAGTESLGRGEAEAILLAKEINAELLLMDDRKGRLAAERAGIKCASIPALLVQAKKTGRVAFVGVVLDRLEKQGGLYLSDRVKTETLRLAAEQPNN